ncbi:MAG: sulfite oxidase-like oxidoreductase [Rhodospirillaceae bacterium]|nr:sulfite oxidase-like oxidoreductase [Rhodospirillaceae bacterium]
MTQEQSPEGTWGKIKQKLIDSKQQWAKEKRLITGKSGNPKQDRLPPGQREVKNWPVLDLGIQPDISMETWQLRIDGLVKKPTTWNWQQFSQFAIQDFTSDIHCVTAWSRFDNHWQGVSTRAVLEAVEPLDQAKFVICHSHDGYTTNLTLEEFAAEDALLALAWEGKPISREHGGPVRVVVPKLYFWKSAKWLKSVELSDQDKPGYWEVRGYHNHGNPWEEERYGR